MYVLSVLLVLLVLLILLSIIIRESAHVKLATGQGVDVVLIVIKKIIQS